MSENKIAKIVFAGQTNVGKSSILYRFDRDHCPELSSTLGSAYMRKIINRNNDLVTLDIWDTAGQERYHSITTFYFRGATYCILVFDLTDFNSFKTVNIWKQICDNSNLTTQPIYFLVGNKLDKGVQAVSETVIRDYCFENNITEYIKTSAYTGEGINTLSESITNHIYTHQTAKYVLCPTLCRETQIKSSTCRC